MKSCRLNVLHDSSVHRLLELRIGTSTSKVVARALGKIHALLLQSGIVSWSSLSHGLVGSWQEDDLAVGRLGHSLHSFEVADLHGRCRREDIGGLSHELGAVHLGLGGNNLRLSDTLALRSHGERLLQLLREDNVLDQHTLHRHTPTCGDVLDDLSNALRNLLPALDDILKNSCPHDVTQGGLSALDQSLTNVGDTESRLVRRNDVVVDDRGQVDGDIVLGHACLPWHLDDLNLDVYLVEALRERVDLDQTRVDGLVELAELGDKTHVALGYLLVGIGAAKAARNSTECSDTSAQSVNYGASR